jgi:basic membrane protein A
MRKQLFVVMALLLAFSAACGPAPEPEVIERTVVETVEVEKEVVVVETVEVEVEVTAEPPPPQPPEKEYKFAAILPGVITDADYNTLGYLGAVAVQEQLGIPMAYSERVAVPDVERVMREYIDDGYNIIFTHGGQFVSQTKDLAGQFPDVFFIGEGDGAVADAPPNMWVIDRNFHIPFYAVGALAAKVTQTGKVGYVGGLTLPFSYAEVHAVEQAISDLGLDVEVTSVWAGNFNDPTKARELTDAMIAEGVDVIMGSLNLGMFGLFEGVKAAPTTVLATAKYVDKASFAPENYLTAALYDWAGPLVDITGRIMEGESGGYYPLGFDTGVALQLPLQNTPEDVTAEIEQIIADIEAGNIEVIKNTEPIE